MSSNPSQSSAQTIVLLAANCRTPHSDGPDGSADADRQMDRDTRRRRRDMVHTKHSYATTPSPALSCASAKRNSDRYASDHSAPKYDVKSPCAGSRSALNAS